jgi:hypothetical protein
MNTAMNPNDVIDAYVTDVIRRVPGRQRDEIGLELHGLLAEMLDERAEAQGRAPDDAMVLALLRDFGTPAEIATRYRAPGLLLLPPESTRMFALLSLAGLALQWALSLPRVFDGSLSPGGWWLTLGLGAFWWPGFLAMGSLLAAWLRHRGLFQPKWKPRIVDPERINRGAMAFGLFGFAVGAALVTSLPWLAPSLPGVLPQVFAFDPEFLRVRAWPVLLLWAGSFASLAWVYVQGRWTPLMRKLEIGFNAAFIALLGWWLAAGPMFQAKATDDGARGALALVIVFIVIDLVACLRRRRTPLRTPHPAA